MACVKAANLYANRSSGRRSHRFKSCHPDHINLVRSEQMCNLCIALTIDEWVLDPRPKIEVAATIGDCREIPRNYARR